MKTCKTCDGWINKQKAIGGVSCEGICLLNIFDPERNDNILFKHNDEIHSIGGESELITGEDASCGRWKAKTETP